MSEEFGIPPGKRGLDPREVIENFNDDLMALSVGNAEIIDNLRAENERLRDAIGVRRSILVSEIIAAQNKLKLAQGKADHLEIENDLLKDRIAELEAALNDAADNLDVIRERTEECTGESFLLGMMDDCAQNARNHANTKQEAGE